MSQDFGAVKVEEHRHGDTLWVAVRARGAEWSWLTREDALRLAHHWMAMYEGVSGQAAMAIPAA
jgi:hypothetical protein